jgi:SpoVK/Ycf46/Vps4 family AAA+-type ATPase
MSEIKYKIHKSLLKKNKNIQKEYKDEVKSMIKHIEMLYNNKDPILDNVNNIEMLYDALCDLNDIVGMENIKASIIKLIKFLLIDTNIGKNKFDEHMLHTVIYGPPGVGKTKVGSVLAKIWGSLGLLKKSKKKENETDIKNNSDIASSIIKLAAIANLKNKRRIDDDNDTEIKSKKVIKMSIGTQTDDIYDINTNNLIINNSQLTLRRKSLTNYNLLESTKYNQIVRRKSISPIYPIIFDNFSKISESNEFLPQLTSLPKLPDIKRELKRKNLNSPIRIVSRNDFVGQYLGQTADKTSKLLNSTLNEGKALFIDEAYSLINDAKDSYGNEALNELNKFMSEKPELVVIFAGYKEKIEKTLFHYQPGFKRRCTWIFNIDKYRPDMLTKIFLNQISESEWKYFGDNKELDDFFTTNFDYFKAFGGDTQKFALYCKLTYAENKFNQNLDINKIKEIPYKTLDNDILLDAFENYKEHYLDKPEENTDFPFNMYS